MAVEVTHRPIQSTTTKAPTNQAALKSQIVKHLAEVRAVGSQDIYDEINRMGGDLAMTDKEAKWICVSLEEDYQCDGKFRPADLCKPTSSIGGIPSAVKPGGGCVDPAEDTTVSRLLDMAASKFGI